KEEVGYNRLAAPVSKIVVSYANEGQVKEPEKKREAHSSIPFDAQTACEQDQNVSRCERKSTDSENDGALPVYGLVAGHLSTAFGIRESSSFPTQYGVENHGGPTQAK